MGCRAIHPLARHGRYRSGGPLFRDHERVAWATRIMNLHTHELEQLDQRGRPSHCARQKSGYSVCGAVSRCRSETDHPKAGARHAFGDSRKCESLQSIRAICERLQEPIQLGQPPTLALDRPAWRPQGPSRPRCGPPGVPRRTLWPSRRGIWGSRSGGVGRAW